VEMSVAYFKGFISVYIIVCHGIHLID